MRVSTASRQFPPSNYSRNHRHSALRRLRFLPLLRANEEGTRRRGKNADILRLTINGDSPQAILTRRSKSVEGVTCRRNDERHIDNAETAQTFNCLDLPCEASPLAKKRSWSRPWNLHARHETDARRISPDHEDQQRAISFRKDSCFIGLWLRQSE